MSDNPLADIMEAFESAGIGHLTDDECCQLLAWLLNHGINTEVVIFNRRLNADIECARRRLGIVSGEYPKGDLLALFDRYVRESKAQRPKWVKELEKKYETNATFKQ